MRTVMCRIPMDPARVYGSEQPDLFMIQGRWYPGVYLYRWEGTSDRGAPIFGERVRVTLPPWLHEDHRTPGEVSENENGIVYGIWADGGELVHSVYEADNPRFVETVRVELQGLPRNPHALTASKSCSGCTTGRVPALLGGGIQAGGRTATRGSLPARRFC